jgi:hypothetical protein
MIAVAGCVVQASINWSETELVRLTALLGGAERLRGSGASLKQCCTTYVHFEFLLKAFCHCLIHSVCLNFGHVAASF